jgi:hypothetical protein
LELLVLQSFDFKLTWWNLLWQAQKCGRVKLTDFCIDIYMNSINLNVHSSFWRWSVISHFHWIEFCGRVSYLLSLYWSQFIVMYSIITVIFEEFVRFRQVFGLHRFKLKKYLVDETVKSVWFYRLDWFSVYTVSLYIGW